MQHSCFFTCFSHVQVLMHFRPPLSVLIFRFRFLDDGSTVSICAAAHVELDQGSKLKVFVLKKVAPMKLEFRAVSTKPVIIGKDFC